ncbi:MarR family transcriptional regulator [bacterium LRH843]|nr:MarR family transcriptional regulator [bacterium LRH843]
MKFYGREVNQLARLFTKTLNQSLSPSGLYSSQWAIILRLYEDGPMTQIGLSHYLAVEAPTITRTLLRLEEMGLIIREDGKDRRERLVRLAPRALEMIPICIEQSEEPEKLALHGVTKTELEQFNYVLQKMIKNLQ